MYPLKDKVNLYRIHKDSLRSSQTTQCASIIKINFRIPYRNISTVSFHNRAGHINKLCREIRSH